MNIRLLESYARYVRYLSVISTTKAGSGHPTSCFSAADLMSTLFATTFQFDVNKPHNPNNDRLIFSKGHAAPLFYALWALTGKMSEKEMLSLRKFGSKLEGHPTMEFAFTEAPTGSLGQGLSIGVGMALNAKLDKLPYKTYVLLGDSECAEGSVWEALAIAAHYKLDNLIGILDVNRLGQRGETLHGHDLKAYKKKIQAFGWKTIVINGHNHKQIVKAYTKANKAKEPVMIIARTYKGMGYSAVQNKNGFHGKPFNKEESEKVLQELGDVKRVTLKLAKPKQAKPHQLRKSKPRKIAYTLGENVATRKAYGNGLKRIFPAFPQMVVLDAEVSNSTHSAVIKETHPERFFEMFIAEQNMVGTALGFARRGKLPFVSTFGAFFSRAYDQIRMSQYAESHIVFSGSHVGVSIGADGASQMALEDLGMFRPLLNSTVLYPSDAVSTDHLLEAAAEHKGLVYVRTTRMATPVIYKNSEKFTIGGSKTLRSSKKDKVTVIGGGVTLHEALKAYDILKNQGISVRVIDLYSIKPLDTKTLMKAAKETKHIISVEDHFLEGGMGEAVQSVVGKVHKLSVTKMPHSGTPEELLDYENISHKAIVRLVKRLQ